MVYVELEFVQFRSFHFSLHDVFLLPVGDSFHLSAPVIFLPPFEYLKITAVTHFILGNGIHTLL